ncbi:cytochrome P450 [Catellatospora sp. TT07R-123]|uniref:cytochrome P450 n=1 Tax=Catellatospora sp. TT07R-123 TaxID=2733863 RepID=UPI001B28AE45|nr:cytochrome P450 [Catellatospora sp. TT07R-123]GHJ44390.1 cytochrome P450 [Catellatospora sp. TT07R-123]
MSDTLATRIPTYPFGNDGLDPRLPDFGLEGVGRVQLPTGQQALLFTRHEHLRELLRSPDFSSDFTRPGFPLIRPLPDEMPRREGSFIRMDPPEHTKFRRMLTPEFMIKHIRTLEPLIQQTVTDALASMQAVGKPADLVEHFALPVPSMVICHLLGVPYADHEFFQERSRILLAWSSPLDVVRTAVEELREYLVRLIERKRGEPGDDMISRLAAERVATGEMTEPELVGLSLLLLIAGHETTSNMIGLSALVMLQHPAQLERLRQDPARIDDTVEELLRYLTIVRTGLTRVAIRDTVVGGHRVPAGQGVIGLLSAANRDADVFPDGDRFDLTRGSHQHMAFGFGIHQCIGQPLARAELRIALAELFTRLPNLELAVDPDSVEFRDAVVFGVRELAVTW